MNNYFESEYFKILLYNNKYNDKFIINMDVNSIIIKRVDANVGWGQNLNLIVRNKSESTDSIINVGSSIDNIKVVDYSYDINNFEKYHYENDFYKIFYISKSHNDIFQINYDEDSKILTVQRIDANGGWGQNLQLKYIDKNSNIEKIITIGSSKYNFIKKSIDFLEKSNYYESSNYKITIFENKYPDLFQILFYEDNNTIYVKRLDYSKGWGQQLMLNVFDIKQNYNFIIYIGASINNEIYKKIDLCIRKTYISLTTIPSRIKLPIFIEHIYDLLEKFKYSIENIFITIPEKYRRFNETVSAEIINFLKTIPKVVIIKIAEDFGPASKYLGPLINHYKEIKNNILIVIDDDRKYNKNLVRNFNIVYNSYPNITFSSGLWSEYFNKDYKRMNENYLELQLFKETNNNKFYFGQGLGGFFGFAIHVKNIEKFINYNLWILNKIEKSYMHDEGIILGYLKFKEETIVYLKHYGCNFIDSELVDALCENKLISRERLEKEILQITNLEEI